MPRIKAAAGRGEARSLAALRVRPCGAERERPGAVWPGPRPPEAWSGGRCARGSTGCCCRSPCSPVGARVARCLYRRGSGLSLVGGVGPRAHGVGVTPSPVTPRCVVPTGEWEPGRGAGGWEGGRNFFPARSRRRSGARGLRAALSFAAAPSRVPGAVRTEPRAPPGRAPRWGGRSAHHPPRGALGPQPGKSPRPPERDENRPFELRDRPRGKPFRLRGAPSTRAVQRAPCAGTPPGRATPRRSAARPRGAGGGSRCRVKSFFLQFAVREE